MVLLGCMLVHPALAQVPDSVYLLTLDEVIQVVSAHPTLQAQRLNAEAQRIGSRRYGAFPNPEVSVQYMPRAVLTGRGHQRSRWQVAQTVPFPGKRRLLEYIAELDAEQTALASEAYALDLAHDARAAYFMVERAQTHLAHLAQFQIQLDTFAEMATVRYEVGQGSQADVLQAQLEKNRLDQQRLRLKRDQRTACATLARLMDTPRVFTCAVSVPADHHAGVSLSVHAVDTTGVQRPEVRQLEVASRQAQHQVALAERRFLPDFNVQLAYLDVAASDALPSANGRDAWMIGVGVSVPLWRSRLRAEREAAQLRQQEVMAQQQALTAAIRAEVTNYRQRMREEAETLNLLNQTLMPQAEGLAESARSTYGAGQTGYPALLAAERARLQVHMDAADALYRYQVAEAGLMRTLGVVDW